MPSRSYCGYNPPKNAGRKAGRNRCKCKRYREAGQREKNKNRRIAKDARRASRGGR